jgi:hypothetical protein
VGKKPHKSFPDDSEKKKVKAQSQQIKYLEKEIKRLKAELATLNAAFRKSAQYMSDESGPLSTEQLIRAAEKHQSLKEAKKEYVSEESERERVRKKFDEWNRKRDSGRKDEEDDN